MITPHLSELAIYPIKSTRALTLTNTTVESRGLAHDRRWMIVDESNTFLTQRSHPQLAFVRTDITSSGLKVRAEGHATLTIGIPNQTRVEVTVWKDEVSVLEASEEAHQWFSRVLGMRCKLVYMDEAGRRPVDPDYAIGNDEVSFADGYPVLLTSTASLEALNRRLVDFIDMSRFRPNLVVSGFPAFAEDSWEEITIGDARFFVVKPCARCVVTTIDPDTGETGKEPLRTLSTFRKKSGQVHFGVNLIPAGSSNIKVGDQVRVVGRRDTAFL